MGEKLQAYFEQANAIVGLQGKIKLAMITKMSARTAVEAPDSPENVKVFEDALAELKKAAGK
jgi:hypothetical protein